MASYLRGEPAMPVASLGPGGPAVSRIGLGLAALGRPAYITGGREHDLPDRSVTAMRDRTFAVLEAAQVAGVRYVDAARSYGRAEPPRRTGRAGRPGPGADHAGHRQAPDPGSQPCPR